MFEKEIISTKLHFLLREEKQLCALHLPCNKRPQLATGIAEKERKNISLTY